MIFGASRRGSFWVPEVKGQGRRAIYIESGFGWVALSQSVAVV